MPLPHFESADSWDDAARRLTFDPRRPADAMGASLRGLRIHVRDHRQRELSPAERSLEAHYDTFVFSQSSHDAAEARRRALEVRYGSDPREIRVLGRDGRSYEAGPEPEPGDPDGRMPAVVTWHDGPMFFLLASGSLAVPDLLQIAMSVEF